MRFSLPSIKCSAAPLRFRQLPSKLDNGTVLGCSRKLEGAAENLIDDSENAFAGWAFDFGFRMLLKGAVKRHSQLAHKRIRYHFIANLHVICIYFAYNLHKRGKKSFFHFTQHVSTFQMLCTFEFHCIELRYKIYASNLNIGVHWEQRLHGCQQ